MNLSYRGVKYSVDPTATKAVEGSVVGHYRGAAYRLKQADTSVANGHIAGLKYRGAVVR
jgi:hypothetical protein